MQMFAGKPFKYSLLLSIFLFCLNLHGQDLLELRHYSTGSFKMDFYIAAKDKKINYHDTLEYYWFKSQKLQVTQGGASGKLLHGNFEKFYKNGQLAERGIFNHGLKDGEWLSWYETGVIKAKYNYKNGSLHGDFIEFDTNGSISEEGQFKKGQKKVKKPAKIKPLEKEDEETEMDSEQTPWFKRLFKFEPKDNPERDSKQLERRRKRQERKMAKERETKND